MIAYAVTPPAVPMMSADWLLLTGLVETGKLALVAPPGTVTLGGTVAAVVLSLDNATERPPAPAGAASAGAARIPAPMTISTPMTARRDSLRCRVDVVNRLVRMEDLLSVGRPPRCGGSASWYGVVGTYATVRRKGQRSRRSGSPRRCLAHDRRGRRPGASYARRLAVASLLLRRQDSSAAVAIEFHAAGHSRHLGGRGAMGYRFR